MASPTSTTILLVEDDATVGAYMQEMLTELGYLVPAVVATAQAALASLTQARPDLVLMDIALEGGQDGIQAAISIRERVDAPVVFVTAHADEATIARAKAAGPHGYLIKPFSERELRTAIEVALGKHALERTMLQRERSFATTLRSIDDAVIATDVEGRITFMNPIAERLTGWDARDAMGKLLEEVFRLTTADGRPVEAPSFQASGEMGLTPSSGKLLARVGPSKEVDDRTAPIVDELGRVTGGVVVFRDVSQSKKRDHELALSQRLATIGTMAASVAHEINNPLAVVVMSLQVASDLVARLEREPSRSEEVSELERTLDDMQVACDRILGVVRDIKRFARPDNERRVVNLVDVLESAVKLSQHQVAHCATLIRDFEDAPCVEGDEGRLVQVFVNLLVNAAQAIGSGRSHEHRIVLQARAPAGGRVVVSVSDDGPGISPANLVRVFDPFFSTKSAGEGTGLGLAISRELVTHLGGTISVESELGHGATFAVSLPIASPGDGPSHAEAPAATSAVSRARLLVIDDEEAIGRLVKRTLAGYHDVVAEHDGAAALERIESDTFDVILCDVMMPNLTGPDVFERATTRHPDLRTRFVFMTGGAFSPGIEQFLERTTNPTIAKPFSRQTLLDVVELVRAEARAARLRASVRAPHT